VTEPPELSVIVPTRNRSEMVRRCIDALADQTEDFDSFEVIVIDDGSTDGGIREMVDGLATPFSLTAIEIEWGGRSKARNAGIEAARGELCLFLDDDVVSAPGLVAAHLAGHRAGDGRLCIGTLEQVNPANGDWYTRAFARGWTRHFERLEHKQATWSDSYGGNISAPTSVLREIGGFAPDLDTGNDIDLGFRLCEAGLEPTFIPDAHALHDDQKPRERLLADVRRHAAGYPELILRHPPMFPKLLGWFGHASRRQLFLRRTLIALRIPVSLLLFAGRLVPGEGRQDILYEFLWKLAFWQAVRRNVSRSRWRELTTP